jgi:hypothetical protein
MSHLATFLEERIEKLRDDWSPEELDLAKAVARDVADLTLKGIAGANVAAELEQANAAADALVGAATISVAQALYEGATDFLGDLLARLLQP